MLRASAGFFFFLSLCQTRRGERWAHCSNRFLLFARSSLQRTWVLPTMHKEITNLCCWCSFFFLLLVIYVGICAPSCSPSLFFPSSFGVGPWFVSACCALACSSPLSGCSVSAQRDFNNKINLQYAETRQTPTLLPLLLLRSSCLLQGCFYALTSDSKAACFFYFLFFPLIFLWPCKKVLEAF